MTTTDDQIVLCWAVVPSALVVMSAMAVGLAGGGCSSKDKEPAVNETKDTVQTAHVVGADTTVTGDWRAACRDAIASAEKAPPEERLFHIASACPVCGTDFQPILRSTVVGEFGPVGTSGIAIDAVLKKCGTQCPGSTRDQFVAAFGNLSERAPSRPWRLLADQCPGAMPPDHPRLASAPLYVLGQITKAAAAADAAISPQAELRFPAPAWTANGVGVGLVPAEHLATDLPGPLVTVSDREVWVGVAPWISWSATGIQVDPSSDSYPGAATPPPALPKVVAAARPGQPGPTAVIAPPGLPAKRLREVIAALPDGAHLAAASARQHRRAWPDIVHALRPLVAIGAAPRGLAISAVAPLRIGQFRGRKASGCTVASPSGDALPAALTAQLGDAVELTIDVTGASVEDVVQWVDRVAAHKVGRVLLASDISWGDLPPCPP